MIKASKEMLHSILCNISFFFTKNLSYLTKNTKNWSPVDFTTELHFYLLAEFCPSLFIN